MRVAIAKRLAREHRRRRRYLRTLYIPNRFIQLTTCTHNPPTYCESMKNKWVLTKEKPPNILIFLNIFSGSRLRGASSLNH